MADARGFAIELERFITQDVPKAALDLQKRIVGEVFTAIVMATPVGNATRWRGNIARAAKGLAPLPKGYVGGQARKNWVITVDTPNRTVREGVDQSGQQALSDGFSVVAGLQQPGRVWISNALPYMEPLENGWSKQAPQGMVARAVAAVTAKYAGGVR